MPRSGQVVEVDIERNGDLLECLDGAFSLTRAFPTWASNR
jgi:hypothetical protein